MKKQRGRRCVHLNVHSKGSEPTKCRYRSRAESGRELQARGVGSASCPLLTQAKHYTRTQSGSGRRIGALGAAKGRMVLNSLSDGGDRLVDGVEHHSVAALPDHPEKKQRRDVQELPGWQW